MPLANTIWVRHRWNLGSFAIQEVPPRNYVFASVGADREDEIIQVVVSAYGSDPIWQPLMAGIRTRMTKRVQGTLGQSNTAYLAACQENEIVAVSGVATEHWTGQNLLTGICVLPAHQRKGLGRYLLASSLHRLKEMRVSMAQVYTEFGSLADRKIYPLFGSSREENVHYPGLDRDYPH